MSGRCKSCNCILEDQEMASKWPGTDEFTELCFVCLSKCSGEIDEDFWSDDLISIEELPEEL